MANSTWTEHCALFIFGALAYAQSLSSEILAMVRPWTLDLDKIQQSF